MKVGQVSGVTGIYNNKGIRKVESTKAVQSKKDVVSISGSGQDFNTVMKALKEVPDVREDKVNELASKYEDGKNNVSSKDIAEKMFNKAINLKA